MLSYDKKIVERYRVTELTPEEGRRLVVYRDRGHRLEYERVLEPGSSPPRSWFGRLIDRLTSASWEVYAVSLVDCDHRAIMRVAPRDSNHQLVVDIQLRARVSDAGILVRNLRNGFDPLQSLEEEAQRLVRRTIERTRWDKVENRLDLEQSILLASAPEETGTSNGVTNRSALETFAKQRGLDLRGFAVDWRLPEGVVAPSDRERKAHREQPVERVDQEYRHEMLLREEQHKTSVARFDRQRRFEDSLVKAVDRAINEISKGITTPAHFRQAVAELQEIRNRNWSMLGSGDSSTKMGGVLEEGSGVSASDPTGRQAGIARSDLADFLSSIVQLVAGIPLGIGDKREILQASLRLVAEMCGEANDDTVADHTASIARYQAALAESNDLEEHWQLRLFQQLRHPEKIRQLIENDLETWRSP